MRDDQRAESNGMEISVRASTRHGHEPITGDWHESRDRKDVPEHEVRGPHRIELGLAAAGRDVLRGPDVVLLGGPLPLFESSLGYAFARAGQHAKTERILLFSAGQRASL